MEKRKYEITFLDKISKLWVCLFHSIRKNLQLIWSIYANVVDRFFIDKGRKILVDILSDTLTFIVLFMMIITSVIAPILTDGKRNLKTERPHSITFTDASGKFIGHKGIRYNDTIALKDYSSHLINAVLAVEDKRFMSHIGIDMFGLLRAIIVNIQAQTIVQGGSTLTQQLAKNLFLTPERSAKRKIQEAFLALWLEINYSKKEILKLYLDHSYLGSGNYGVEAASQNYFNKSVKNINLAEAALIAGLLKAPSKYSPRHDIVASRERTKTVLKIIAKNQFALANDIYKANKNPAKIVQNNNNNADYFLDWLYEKAIKLSGNTSKILTVKTTLDNQLQKTALSVFNNILKKHAQKYNVQQGAFIAMTPSGEIQAMLGGRDYKDTQYNRSIMANRQPGSAFKPILYIAALENGYTAKSVVNDAPIRFGTWSPQNYKNKYFGKVNLTTALQKSLNSVPIRISEDIGQNTIIENAKKMGITKKLNANRSLALGTSEVSLLEMTTAYSTIANNGIKTQVFGIKEIYDAKGKLLYKHKKDTPKQKPLFKKETIRDIKHMLKEVINKGTGKAAKISSIQSYGKTGTTQDYRDAWFIGFTDQLVAGVWLGNDNFQPTNELTGGSLPARIWKQFFVKSFTINKKNPLIEEYNNKSNPVISDTMTPLHESQQEINNHNWNVFKNIQNIFQNQPKNFP